MTTDHPIEYLVDTISQALSCKLGTVVEQPQFIAGLPAASARMIVRIHGAQYAVGVAPIIATQSSQMGRVAAEAAAEIAAVREQQKAAEKKPQNFREFEIDHRDNPRLHELYVGWARETLQKCKEFCDDLYADTRWPCASFASTLWEEVRHQIKRDAAWFEAAALEFAGDGEEEDLQPPPVYAGDSLRNLPPGEYVGTIQEKNGKLYFEVDEDQS